MHFYFQHDEFLNFISENVEQKPLKIAQYDCKINFGRVKKIKESIITETGSLELTYEITTVIKEEIKFYGVKVSAENQYGEIETKTVNDITSDKDKIEAFIRLIQLGHVTPTTLQDIAEDFIE